MSCPAQTANQYYQYELNAHAVRDDSAARDDSVARDNSAARDDLHVLHCSPVLAEQIAPRAEVLLHGRPFSASSSTDCSAY